MHLPFPFTAVLSFFVGESFFSDQMTSFYVYNPDLSVKRKIEKHREKVLRYDSILQSNAFVEPVPSSTGKKSKKKSKLQIAKDTAQQGQKVVHYFILNVQLSNCKMLWLMLPWHNVLLSIGEKSFLLSANA